LAPDRRTGETAKQGELANVIEGVCDWALKELFGCFVEGLVRSEVRIESLQRFVEAGPFFIPSARLGIFPGLLPPGDGARPVGEGADVREDLGGSTAGSASPEIGKGSGRAAKRLATAISNGGHGVTEKLARRISRAGHRGTSLNGRSRSSELDAAQLGEIQG